MMKKRDVHFANEITYKHKMKGSNYRKLWDLLRIIDHTSLRRSYYRPNITIIVFVLAHLN